MCDGERQREKESVYVVAASAVGVAIDDATAAFVAMCADGMADEKKLKERDRDKMTYR